MEELAPLLAMQLGSGGAARLTVTGYSMMPMLRNHRDAVELIAPREPLRKGDIALYKRENGSYVLHRIIDVREGTYICCGDNQAEQEPVRQEQLLALVTGFVRKGKYHGVQEWRYRLYTALWVYGFPFRRPYIIIRRWLGKQIRRKKYV